MMTDSSTMDPASVKPCGLCPVRAQGICSVVGSQHFLHLASLAKIRDHPCKTIFIREHDPADHLFILLWGTAKLFKVLPDGRRQTIGFSYPGAVLGLAADDGYSFTAESLQAVRLCRLPRARLKLLAREVQRLDERLMDCVVDDLVDAQNQMLLIGRKTATERLASFLQGRLGRERRLRPTLALPMSRGDLADFLAMSLETLSRAFAKLKKEGLIETPTLHEVVILQPALLAALADGGAMRDENSTPLGAPCRRAQI